MGSSSGRGVEFSFVFDDFFNHGNVFSLVLLIPSLVVSWVSNFEISFDWARSKRLFVSPGRPEAERPGILFVHAGGAADEASICCASEKGARDESKG